MNEPRYSTTILVNEPFEFENVVQVDAEYFTDDDYRVIIKSIQENILKVEFSSRLLTGQAFGL